MSADPQPQKAATETRDLDDEASERYAEWRDACAAVDDAYCEWLCASADEQPGAFAAYRAALDREESLATIYGAVVERLTQGHLSGLEIGSEEIEELPVAHHEGLRVLIVDHDGFARRMLLRVLQEVDDVTDVAMARDGREALELSRRCPPDVLLVAIGVPPSGGVELIRKLMADLPRTRTLTVSAGVDWDQAALAALRAGAVGHIDKDTAPEQIARLVVLAAAGQAIVPERLMARLLASSRTPPAGADGPPDQ